MGAKRKEQFQKNSVRSIGFLLCMYVGVGVATVGPYLPLLLCFVVLLILLFATLVVRGYSIWFFLLLCSVGLWAGYTLCTQYRQHMAAMPLYGFTDQAVVLRGLVCDAPDRRVDHIKLTLCVTHVLRQDIPYALPGKILVSISKYQPISYGDVLEVSGTLELPISDEEFSYANYLLKDGITHVLYQPLLFVVHTGQGHPLFAWTFLFRDAIEAQLNSQWHEPEASFLAGLLIGSRKGIPPQLLSSFQRTGLTHIIAISGYNITLLIVIITSLFRFLSKRVQIICSIVVICLFTILVGASSAVVRASIMGILGLLALLLYQKSTVLITILVSGMLMLLLKPLSLVYDVGYQLSFLAVLGLLYVGPVLTRWTSRLPDALGIKEGLLLTISATITTTPAILYHFGLFSVVAPVANVLVAPFLPLAMLFGFLGLCGSVILPPLGFLFQVIATWCLDAVITVATTAAALPWASVNMARLTPWGVACAYLVLGLGLWCTRDSSSNNDTASPPQWSPHDTTAPGATVASFDG